jgi:hypothetical protein
MVRLDYIFQPNPRYTINGTTGSVKQEKSAGATIL